MHTETDPLEIDSLDSKTTPNRSWLARRLTTENPFYLLSAACVIHSTGLSIGSAVPLPVLLLLIGGYLLLLAITGMGIVKAWQVWDDARSIFLTLVLLMLELAICFDQPLTVAPVRSTIGLLALTLISISLVELIVRVIGIRFPWCYRVPFYLQLSLVMLASLFPVLAQAIAPESIRWVIYGVSILTGVSMLTLIPAIRSGPQHVEFSGCPWRWPYHPWSLFVVLWVAIGFRLYLLTISFDAALELNSSQAYEGMGGMFGGYLLVPMLLGLAVLLIEGARVHRHRLLLVTTLGMPVLCVGLSIQPQQADPALQAFLAEFGDGIGSPMWVATLAAVSLFLYAWMREIPAARRCLVIMLLTLTVVGPRTIDLWTLTSVNLAVLAGAVLLLLVIAWRQSQIRFAVEACGWGIVGVGQRGGFDGWEMTPGEIQWHLMAIVLAVSARWMSSENRDVALGLLMAFVVLACVRGAFHGLLAIRAPFFCTLYLMSLTTASYVLRRHFRDQWERWCTTMPGVLGYALLLLESARALSERVQWSGLPQFLFGLALLHLGVVVSAWKGGFFRRLPASGDATRPRAVEHQ